MTLTASCGDVGALIGGERHQVLSVGDTARRFANVEDRGIFSKDRVELALDLDFERSQSVGERLLVVPGLLLPD